MELKKDNVPTFKLTAFNLQFFFLFHISPLPSSWLICGHQRSLSIGVFFYLDSKSLTIFPPSTASVSTSYQSQSTLSLQQKFFENPSQVTLKSQNSVLHIIIALPQHSGTYECEASNRAGSIRNFFKLVVEETYTTPKGLIAGEQRLFYPIGSWWWSSG